MEELKIETPNGLQFGAEIIGLPDCKFSKYWPLVCCSRATQQIRYRPAVGKEVCLSSTLKYPCQGNWLLVLIY